MKKLKLRPSARDKRRYFLISASNDKVEKLLLEYLGVLGFAKAAYVYVKTVKGKVVGSCLRGELGDVRAGLGMGGVEIEKVSGTLKGLGL